MSKPFKATGFEPKVDLDHKIVSLLFQDEEGKQVDVWLNRHSVFVLQAEIDRMIRENPEMQSWKPN